MKQICFYFILLFIQQTWTENNIFYPLLEQFSNIAEEYEGKQLSLRELPKIKRELIPLEEEILGNPVVESSSGKITGSTNPEAHAFYSIPYGKAPVGDLRFQPPVAIENQGEIDASVPDYVGCFEFNPACTAETCDQNLSEDCLVVNVHVPSKVDLTTPPHELLPVMFWLHGGGFSMGAGTKPYYDAKYLSNITNTVVVSVNYRLGPFGFLVYDEGETRFEGNQGIKDQQLALKWVHENIENFGGDKNEVTIFGQSAGAQSTIFHLMSDESNKYFKRMIMQSNPAGYYYPSKEQAKRKAEALLKAIDCEDEEEKLECLRSTSALDIVNTFLQVTLSQPIDLFNLAEAYRPVLDEEFPQNPLDFFRDGNWKTPKEVIIGVMSEELLDYVHFVFGNFNVGKFLFKIITNLIFGDKFGPAVFEKYSEIAETSTDPNYTDLLAQEISDMLFVCPNKALGRFMSSATTAAATSSFSPIYFYLFDYRTEAPNCADIILPFCGYASHSVDVPYVFANGRSLGYDYTENDIAVETMINNFWGHFAHTGSPADDSNTWPNYTKSIAVNDGVMEWSNVRLLAPESYVESDYKKDICAFWDELGFYFNVTEPIDATTSVVTQRWGPLGRLMMSQLRWLLSRIVHHLEHLL